MLLKTDQDLGFALSSYLHGRLCNAGLKRGGKIGAQNPSAVPMEGA